MKNLKKLLAMSVVFAMIISSMSTLFMVSAYDDVTTSNAGLYEAVSVLSDIGIVKGKDATNFGAADNIKRSEAAAILVRMVGLDSAATASVGKTPFKDVAADHWASGYINVASSQGIVNGNGDGTFTPDENVTYEQFLKMTMCALGYQDIAIAKGGYPTGYVIVANDYKVSKGIKVNGPAPATRADIALITYAAIDTALREQTGWGSNVEFTIYDGSNNSSKKTLLTEKLNIKKFRATIQSDGRSSIVGVPQKGMIKYEITDDFDLNDSDYAVSTVNNPTSNSAKVGKSNAAAYLGYRAVIYVGQDDVYKEDFIVTVIPDTARVKELTLTSKKYMDLVKTTAPNFSGDSPILYYWLNPDTDKKSQEAQVSPSAVMLVNGAKLDSAIGAVGTPAYKVAMFNVLNNLQNGHVKLVNNNTNSDDLYDIIYVTTYVQDIVDEVDVENKSITFKEGNLDTLKFDKDDLPTDFTYTLKDKAGVDVDLKTIKENDVIAVAFSDNAAQAASPSTYMDVIVLTDKVTGTVTEVNSNTQEYSIGGKFYKESLSGTVALNLEDNGTFFLDVDGKVIYKLKGTDPTITSNNYAYLVSASNGSAGGLDDNYELRIFTKEGTVKIVKLSSSVRVFFAQDALLQSGLRGDVSKTYSSTSAAGSKPVDLANFLIAYIGNTAVNGTTLYTNVGADGQAAINNLVALKAISPADQVASKVVSLTLNSDGNVSKITFPNVTVAGGAVTNKTDEQNFTLSGDITKAYKASTKSFGNIYKLTDSTKVMYISNTAQADYDNFELRSITSFTDDKDYNVQLFDLDQDSNVGLVVLTQDSGFVGYDSSLSVVDRLSVAKDAEGNDIDVITVASPEGKYTSYQTSSKGYKVYLVGTVASAGDDIRDVNLTVGDAIQFTVNAAGKINGLAKIFDVTTKTLIDNDTAYVAPNANGIPTTYYVNEDVNYIFAKVVKAGSSVQIKDDGLMLNKAAASSMKYYEFDQTLTRNDPAVSITSSGIKKYDVGEYYYIVSRLYSSQAVDVIQYRFSADVPAGNLNTIAAE